VLPTFAELINPLACCLGVERLKNIPLPHRNKKRPFKYGCFSCLNDHEQKFLKSWLVYDVRQGDSIIGQPTTRTDMAIGSFCSFLAIDLSG